METIKKYWGIAAGVITVILGLFFYEKTKRKEAESDLLQAEGDKTDAVLAQQQKDNAASFEEEKKQLEQEKLKTLTKEEMLEYLKKL